MADEFTFALYGNKYTVDGVFEERSIEVDPDDDDVMKIRDELISQLEYVEVNYAVDFKQGVVKPLAVYIDGVEFRPVTE